MAIFSAFKSFFYSICYSKNLEKFHFSAIVYWFICFIIKQGISLIIINIINLSNNIKLPLHKEIWLKK